jgi:hypothetical protein
MASGPHWNIHGASREARVTLILGMSKPEGIYMSTDYRVSNSLTGELIDDATVKFLQAKYPPDDGGPVALFGFTGLATMPDGTQTGDWIRETIRGETDVIDVSMRLLLERLNRDAARKCLRHRVPLIINVLVLEPNRRLFGGFTNLKRTGDIAREFAYVMEDLNNEPFVFSNGSGAVRLHADRAIVELLGKQISVRPRKPLDHMKLLASINRRVARDESSLVSPHCHVAFVSGDERFGPQSQAFADPGVQVPFKMPMVLFGLDLTGMMERFVEDSGPFIRGETNEAPVHRPFDDRDLKRRA